MLEKNSFLLIQLMIQPEILSIKELFAFNSAWVFGLIIIACILALFFVGCILAIVSV